MGSHINKDGQFQSDKYPTCPPDIVPLKVTDARVQDLLYIMAERWKDIDPEFAGDLKERLFKVGYVPSTVQQASAIPSGVPTCGICGTLMELRFWDRPGGPPGNGWGCPKCHPWSP
jgi:hypothetical protein